MMKEIKKQQRGGARKGAGRKREGKDCRKAVTAMVSAESYAKVKSMFGRGEFGRCLDDFIMGL